MKQLTKMDSLLFYSEGPRTPLHISPLLIYKPPAKGQEPVRFKDILQNFQDRLHTSPVYRRKLSKVIFDLDSPYWIEDEEFDLEYHVRHIALPKPGDWRQFCILMARLHSRPLDLTRPPWEAFVIEGLDNINGLPKGSFALYMKIHHCAIDGMTGNQMVEALHDSAPDTLRESVVDVWKGEEEPSQLRKLTNAYMKMFKTPAQLSALAKHAVKSRSAEVREAISGGVEDHGIKDTTVFNDTVSPHRVFGGLRMELETIKKIKNSVSGCTLNDVMLSITAGAMRHYLEEKGELPDDSLVVGVPISTRTEANINAEGGNEISAMRLNLRTDIADPRTRVLAINDDAISSKAYANAVGAERASTTFDAIPTGLASFGTKVMRRLARFSARRPFAHTMVTNVPGPRKPMYLCGAEASLWIGISGLLDGIGLAHTVNSYNEYIFLSYLSCRQMMPDPEFYHQCINRSFQEHVEMMEKAEAEKSEKPASLKAVEGKLEKAAS